MAPRRGGGSSGGSGSGVSVSCPGAFSGVYSSTVVYFVASCLFFVLTLAVLIALCCVRKRHGIAKKLAGPIYVLSLSCMLIAYAMIIIATMLRECGTTSLYSYYDWAIAFNLFGNIGTYLLLVVVVYGVNNLLRERLGSNPTFFKIIYIVILGFMGALTAAYIGLQSYNIWLLTEDGLNSDQESKSEEQLRLSVAYYVFYLLSVLAAGALSIVTLVSMRSRSIPIGDLLGWIIALTFCMFMWILFTLIDVGSTLQSNYLGETYYKASYYLQNFFQFFAYVVILFLAKSRAWDTNTAVANPTAYDNTSYPIPVGHGEQPVFVPAHPQQQQYAYTGVPPMGQQQQQQQQQYYYQQQPVYNGMPVNGNGQMVQVK